MTIQELQEVLSLCSAQEVNGWFEVPEGRHPAVHLASNGVGLAINRIVKLRHLRGQVQVHTAREETYVFSIENAFACAFEDKDKRESRKAGFI